MFCTKCGFKNKDASKFCEKCGTKLEQLQPLNTEPPVEQAEPPVVKVPVTQPLVVESAEAPVFAALTYESTTEPVSLPTKKAKKSKKKPIIIAAVSVFIVAVVVLAIYLSDSCKSCGKPRNGNPDWQYVADCGPLCWDCYSSIVRQVLDNDAAYYTDAYWDYFDVVTDCETLRFYTDVYLGTYTEHSDISDYYYEWSSSDIYATVDVEVIGEECCKDYGFSNFGELLNDFFEEITDDEDVYALEKGRLANGLPMVAGWYSSDNEDCLVIETYTDNYYYSFRIYSDDNNVLEELYDSIYYIEVQNYDN